MPFTISCVPAAWRRHRWGSGNRASSLASALIEDALDLRRDVANKRTEDHGEHEPRWFDADLRRRRPAEPGRASAAPARRGRRRRCGQSRSRRAISARRGDLRHGLTHEAVMPRRTPAPGHRDISRAIIAVQRSGRLSRIPLAVTRIVDSCPHDAKRGGGDDGSFTCDDERRAALALQESRVLRAPTSDRAGAVILSANGWTSGQDRPRLRVTPDKVRRVAALVCERGRRRLRGRRACGREANEEYGGPGDGRGAADGCDGPRELDLAAAAGGDRTTGRGDDLESQAEQTLKKTAPLAGRPRHCLHGRQTPTPSSAPVSGSSC